MSAPEDNFTTTDISSKVCPIPKVHVSTTHTALFNVPGTTLMRWIVGDGCRKLAQVDNAMKSIDGNDSPAQAANPFQSGGFMTIFFLGLILTWTIVILTVVVLILRKKKKLYRIGTHQQIVLATLDISLIVSAILLGIFSTVLIYNNEKLHKNLPKSGIAERVELHTGKTLCLIRTHYVIPEEVDTSQLPHILEKAFVASIQRKNMNHEWRDYMKRLIDQRTETPGANDSDIIDEVRKYAEKELTPEGILDGVYYVIENENSTEDTTEHFDAFENALNELFNVLSLDLASGSRMQILHPRRNAMEPYFFSWMIVFTAVFILIVCLFARATLLFRVKKAWKSSTVASTTTTMSSSNTSNASQVPSKIMQEISSALPERVPVICAITISLLGAVMISFYTWGVYEGYLITCYASVISATSYPRHKVQLAEGPEYAIKLNEFMEKCEKGDNFISAFGEQFFTDTQLMAAYGVNLTEPDDRVPEKMLEANVERYRSHMEALKTRVLELSKDLRSILKPGHGFALRDIMASPTHIAAMEQSPTEFDLDDGFLSRYRDEVNRMTGAKPRPSFGKNIKQALLTVGVELHNKIVNFTTDTDMRDYMIGYELSDVVEAIEDKCDDIPAMWFRWRKRVDEDFNAPFQGQWLCCVIIGLLCFLIFVITLLLSETINLDRSDVSLRSRSIAGRVLLSGSDCRLLSASDKCLSVHTLKSQQSDVLNRPDGTISQQDDVLRSVNGPALNTTEQLLRSEAGNPKSKAYEIAEQDHKKTKTKEEKDEKTKTKGKKDNKNQNEKKAKSN